MVFKRCILPLLPVVFIGLLATGCQTYKDKNHVVQYWRMGDLTNAVREANLMAKKNPSGKDAVIWHLEQGAVLRGVGQYVESNRAFDQAQEETDQYEQKAKVRLGQETAAMLSNQANLAYEGRTYDGVMLNTYKALNYLELGEPDKARPEFIRAYQRQQDAVELNKKRIAKAQEESARNKATVNQKDPKYNSQMQDAYKNLDNLKPYADYVNPFTVYLDGLFFMAQAADNSDLERAHKSLERVVAYDPDNPYVKEDLAAVNDLINGKPLPPTTYVILETGCAPIRDQIRIDVPILVSDVSYVGLAFPTLKFQGDYLPNLNVTAETLSPIINDTNPAAGTGATTNVTMAPAGIALTTSPVANMDSVIGLDFKNELPVIIAKTITSALVKGAGSYAANNTVGQQNETAGAVMRLFTALYQIAVNIADTRTWTTLPKEFQVCRFPTPPDRKIMLETPDGRRKIPVTIEGGTINIVYVKSITASGPLLVSQIKLK